MPWFVDGLPDATLADPPPRHTLAFIRPLALALGRLGVDSNAYLRRLGVPEGAREGFVPATTALDALEEIAERIGVPHLGIELARNVPMGVFGRLDYRFGASATLFAALETFGPRQTDFVESVRYDLRIDEDMAVIEMCPVYRFPRLYPVAQTFGLAFVVRRLRDVLGDAVVKLTAARLVPPAPRETRVYDEFFGVPVEFGAPSYEIAFARELLEARLLTASPEIAQVLAPRAEPPPAEPFVDRVRAAIGASLGEVAPDVTIVDVSSRLGMTPRSLQRRLREKGASFSVLVDEARRDLAQNLLSDEGTLLCDVAYRLGFSGLSAFFKAFRRWTGVSPREFQRTHH
jgi:AraC-like DNA-binding protein